MGCFITIVGLIAPRLAIAVLWLFTGWFSTVSDSIVITLLGFIFLPYSFLWYSAVIHWFGGEWGFLQIVVMVIAVLTDLGAGKEGIRH